MRLVALHPDIGDTGLVDKVGLDLDVALGVGVVHPEALAIAHRVGLRLSSDGNGPEFRVQALGQPPRVAPRDLHQAQLLGRAQRR